MTRPNLVELFRVDPDAFHAWVTDRADSLTGDLPAPAPCPRAAAALEQLVEEAVVFGHLVGDHRVELQVVAADDPPGPGYVLIVRPRGQPHLAGLTAGWTDLTYPAPDAEPHDVAWTYLTRICDQANALLTDPRKVLP